MAKPHRAIGHFGHRRALLFGSAASITCSAGCVPTHPSAVPKALFLGVGPQDKDDSYASFMAAWEPTAARYGLGAVRIRHRPVADLDPDTTRTDVLRHLADRHDLVVAPSGSTAMASMGAQQRGPIVFATYLDPVQSGLARSLEHPGRRATGVSLQDRLHAKRLELLRDAYPGRRTVGVILDSQWLRHFDAGALIDTPARRLGLSTMRFVADDEAQLVTLMREPRARLPDAWYVAPTYVADLAADAIRKALLAMDRPSIHASLQDVEAGSPLAYVQDESFVYAALADLGCKVLKGADASNLAVVTPWRHVLAVRPREWPPGQRVSASVVRRADVIV